MRRRFVDFACLCLIVLSAAGCAAKGAYGRGAAAASVDDWDAAVEHYTKAVQADPERAEYKIALERAMMSASYLHLSRARELESTDQLDAALLEVQEGQ